MLTVGVTTLSNHFEDLLDGRVEPTVEQALAMLEYV
jgi:hypothetical protein